MGKHSNGFHAVSHTLSLKKKKIIEIKEKHNNLK